MEKLLTGITEINAISEMFSGVEKISSPVMEFSLRKNRTPKTLSACVRYLSKINDVENDLSGVCFGFKNIVLNDELSDRRVRQIAEELAIAVDKNSAGTVKELKNKYGKEKEFAIAKDFLNKKCKEVWNVFADKNKILKVPHEAMKTLGISNIPPLETLLADSLKFYEKNNTSATSNIISNILKNKNLPYSMEDIHMFMKAECKKGRFNCNFKTVSYLISEQNYNRSKLLELGAEKDVIKQALKELPFIKKIKYYRNSCF